jgi:hypothetical protein
MVMKANISSFFEGCIKALYFEKMSTGSLHKAILVAFLFLTTNATTTIIATEVTMAVPYSASWSNG